MNVTKMYACVEKSFMNWGCTHHFNACSKSYDRFSVSCVVWSNQKKKKKRIDQIIALPFLNSLTLRKIGSIKKIWLIKKLWHRTLMQRRNFTNKISSSSYTYKRVWEWQKGRKTFGEVDSRRRSFKVIWKVELLRYNDQTALAFYLVKLFIKSFNARIM